MKELVSKKSKLSAEHLQSIINLYMVIWKPVGGTELTSGLNEKFYQHITLIGNFRKLVLGYQLYNAHGEKCKGW